MSGNGRETDGHRMWSATRADQRLFNCSLLPASLPPSTTSPAVPVPIPSSVPGLMIPLSPRSPCFQQSTGNPDLGASVQVARLPGCQATEDVFTPRKDQTSFTSSLLIFLFELPRIVLSRGETARLVV